MSDKPKRAIEDVLYDEMKESVAIFSGLRAGWWKQAADLAQRAAVMAAAAEKAAKAQNEPGMTGESRSNADVAERMRGQQVLRLTNSAAFLARLASGDAVSSEAHVEWLDKFFPGG